MNYMKQHPILSAVNGDRFRSPLCTISRYLGSFHYFPNFIHLDELHKITSGIAALFRELISLSSRHQLRLFRAISEIPNFLYCSMN